jgi:GTP cyclohydrolase II
MVIESSDVDLAGLSADVRERMERSRWELASTAMPFVTLTYAQSIDGSIAACNGAPVELSGTVAMDFTHQLRAMHDAILIGINTVMTDDPLLTVRRVKGANPRPVVLDSTLRIPPACRLVQRRDVATIVATTEDASEEKARHLTEAGAEVWRFPATQNGEVEIAALLARLAGIGISSVMVEGGSRVITSIITAGLAHQLILTVSPRFLGGVRAVGALEAAAESRRELVRVRYVVAGGDLMIHGEFA